MDILVGELVQLMGLATDRRAGDFRSANALERGPLERQHRLGMGRTGKSRWNTRRETRTTPRYSSNSTAAARHSNGRPRGTAVGKPYPRALC